MSKISLENTMHPPEKSTGFRAQMAKLLGVEAESKENLYLELSRGATLYDLVYWLQIFFAAGIATLGLVMNSPAVIIGAMLISPLMGPILSTGLALASGDMILGLRSVAKLALSAMLAIFFAVSLVTLLPFREMTDEIAARTQPNTLDLFIALFSGAVGSIATCRDVKGVVTSIPGVAIAVALMPPLCVTGYGLGLILTFNGTTGWRIASGGGLLFLTNLFAITFTAMIVFLIVRLGTPHIRAKAEEWEHKDPESAAILKFIERFPRLEQAREIRSLSVRFAMILIPLVVILIPLTRAFSQLQTEISQQQQENLIRRESLDLWQQNFQMKPDGAARSTVDKLTILEKEGKLNIEMRLFDEETYTAEEKQRYVKMIAARLNRTPESINLRLTEIPTTSVFAALRASEAERRSASTPPTVAELQSNIWQQVDGALSKLSLPPNSRLLSRQVMTNGTNPLNIKIVYLGDDNLTLESQNSIAGSIRTNLQENDAQISLERIPTDIGFIDFPRNSSSTPVLAMLQLDFVGRVMHENPSLQLLVAVQPRKAERQDITAERLQAVKDYLETRWQVMPDKIKLSADVQPEGKARLSFRNRENPIADGEILSAR
jgi:uncharacterized hydrophobic protein (TIGR00271 family)